MVFQLMLASRSYVTHLQFYQSNPTDKQHMTQKKAATQNSYGQHVQSAAGEIRHIQFIKQQSQRIANCYTLALALFICKLRTLLSRN